MYIGNVNPHWMRSRAAGGCVYCTQADLAATAALPPLPAALVLPTHKSRSSIVAATARLPTITLTLPSPLLRKAVDYFGASASVATQASRPIAPMQPPAPASLQPAVTLPLAGAHATTAPSAARYRPHPSGRRTSRAAFREVTRAGDAAAGRAQRGEWTEEQPVRRVASQPEDRGSHHHRGDAYCRRHRVGVAVFPCCSQKN